MVALPQPSLGPLGRIRHGWRNQLLPHYQQQPFPGRCVLWRGHRLRDRAVCSLTREIKRGLRIRFLRAVNFQYNANLDGFGGPIIRDAGRATRVELRVSDEGPLSIRS
jgi:hypothetical protein